MQFLLIFAYEMSFLTGKERPGKINVLLVDHHVLTKFNFFIVYIFTRSVRKALNAILNKNET